MSAATIEQQVQPRGWLQAVAAGPIDRPDALCWCGARAVTATHRSWLCAAHPPQTGEWGHHLDWTPEALHPASHPPREHRCYAPRCPQFHLAAGGQAPQPDELSIRRQHRHESR